MSTFTKNFPSKRRSKHLAPCDGGKPAAGGNDRRPLASSGIYGWPCAPQCRPSLHSRSVAEPADARERRSRDLALAAGRRQSAGSVATIATGNAPRCVAILRWISAGCCCCIAPRGGGLAGPRSSVSRHQGSDRELGEALQRRRQVSPRFDESIFRAYVWTYVRCTGVQSALTWPLHSVLRSAGLRRRDCP